MTDQFDRAQELDAMAALAAMEEQRIRAARAPKLAPSGECQNPRCGEEFPAGDNRLFCNSHCAAEHQRLTRNQTP